MVRVSTQCVCVCVCVCEKKSLSVRNDVMCVSLQCPVNDLHQNALSKGVYQTMLSSASLPIIAVSDISLHVFSLSICLSVMLTLL